MRRVPDAHFAARYDHAADPWDLDGRWYEQRKRALTVAALPRPRYRSAFEPGCANGLLTAELATRCDEVRAMDVAPAAVAATKRRCGDHDGVHVRLGRTPSWTSSC
jgi:methylase of polypeptide subunit release factors